MALDTTAQRTALLDTRRTALLYTKDEQAVRLEVHEAPVGVRLIVYGPGTAYRAVDFPDGTSLTTHQMAFERGLLDNGFRLQAIAERRGGVDRRARPHDNTDRRR